MSYRQKYPMGIQWSYMQACQDCFNLEERKGRVALFTIPSQRVTGNSLVEAIDEAIDGSRILAKGRHPLDRGVALERLMEFFPEWYGDE